MKKHNQLPLLDDQQKEGYCLSAIEGCLQKTWMQSIHQYYQVHQVKE
jgi:hypothetical protein